MKKIIAFVLSLALLTGCANTANNVEEGKLNVVTSFFPAYDLVSRIGGDNVNVTNLTETGDAHTYEPSIKDMETITKADLLVVNGAGFEPWVENIKSTNPDLKILELSEGIKLISGSHDHDHDHNHAEESFEEAVPYTETATDDHDHDAKSMTEADHDHDHDTETMTEADHDHDHDNDDVVTEEHDHDHDHGEFDPHTWLSLENPVIMLGNIKDKLVEIDATNKDAYNTNYEKAKGEFESFADEYISKFANYQGKEFIAPHTAFGYLVNELGIEQIGIEGINSVNEPNAARMKEIVDIMNEHDIKTVFYEYGGSDKVANSIANEIGGNVKAISTLEVISKEDREKGDDYLSLMKMNLDNILDSFEGR